jgi:hypothetical protein
MSPTMLMPALVRRPALVFTSAKAGLRGMHMQSVRTVEGEARRRRLRAQSTHRRYAWPC